MLIPAFFFAFFSFMEPCSYIKNYVQPKTMAIVCFPEPGDRIESFEEHYQHEISEIQRISDAHFVFQTVFGPVPIELDGVYPFGQTVLDPKMAAELSETPEVIKLMKGYSHDLGSAFSIIWTGEDTIESLKMMAASENKFDLDAARCAAISDYQFGKGASNILLTGELEFMKSKNTGKIRNVHSDGEHILSLRAADGLFTLKKAGAVKLHNALKPPKLRAVVTSDTAEFNRQGKSVFAKFVISCDPELRIGDEVLVTDEADNLLAIGRMLLISEEMAAFDLGIAIKVREGIE